MALPLMRSFAAPLAAELLERATEWSSYGPDAAFATLAGALVELRRFLQCERRDRLGAMRELFARVADEAGPHLTAGTRLSAFVEGTGPYLDRLGATPQPSAPWLDGSALLPDEHWPTMHGPELLRYYTWLAASLPGTGAVVELGAWLGGTTSALAAGLRRNPRARDVRIVAVDSFRWESWMAAYLPPAVGTPPAVGESYVDVFLSVCDAYRDLIDPRPRYVGPYNGYRLGTPAWDGGAIDLFVYDIGARLDADFRLAWNVYSPAFVANRTVVVLGEFCKLQADELRRFWCDHEAVLTPLHKPFGAAKAFRFEGPALTL